MLVLYCSSRGHMEAMANAAADGAREAGAEVTVKRVAEIVPEDVAKAAHYKLDQAAPIADPLELADYDAVIFGVPTYFGVMSAQMKNFLDQTGRLLAKGAHVNKVCSVMASTATQHGGQQTTIITTQIVLQHHGFIIVQLSYAYAGQTGVDQLRGGSPYSATAFTAAPGAPLRDNVA